MIKIKLIASIYSILARIFSSMTQIADIRYISGLIQDMIDELHIENEYSIEYKVLHYLNNGWSLYGELQQISGLTAMRWVQAVVRYAPIETYFTAQPIQECSMTTPEETSNTPNETTSEEPPCGEGDETTEGPLYGEGDETPEESE
jgi:hypothetical protein